MNPNLKAANIPVLESERQRSRSCWATGGKRPESQHESKVMNRSASEIGIGIGVREGVRGRGGPPVRARGGLPLVSPRAKVAPPPPARNTPSTRGAPPTRDMKSRPVSVMPSNRTLSPSVSNRPKSVQVPAIPETITLEYLEKELEYERAERQKLEKQVEGLMKRLVALENNQS